MKVINDLVVVEVPKGYEVCILYGYVQILDMYNTWNPIEELPFPCTIIGLASEIRLDVSKRVEVLTVAGTNYRYPEDTTSYNAFMTTNILYPTDTTDLLFLKRN